MKLHIEASKLSRCSSANGWGCEHHSCLGALTLEACWVEARSVCPYISFWPCGGGWVT